MNINRNEHIQNKTWRSKEKRRRNPMMEDEVPEIFKNDFYIYNFSSGRWVDGHTCHSMYEMTKTWEITRLEENEGF